MDKTQAASSSGMPLFLLFLTFMVLKLTKVIDWSWLWVTAPLWGGIALVAGIFILIGVFALCAAIVGSISARRRRPF